MNEIMAQIVEECKHLETPEAKIDWLFKQLAQERLQSSILSRRIENDLMVLEDAGIGVVRK